jgi:hypothetical protein
MSDDSQNRNDNSSVAAMAPDALSDEQLILKVQEGDGDAFTVLFDRYNRLVLTIALRIVREALPCSRRATSVRIGVLPF